MEQNQVTPSALERRIDIAVSLADIEKEVDARLKRMARTVKMPGFRPGKVPMKIVAQTHGGQARGEAVGAAVEKAFGEKVRADNPGKYFFLQMNAIRIKNKKNLRYSISENLRHLRVSIFFRRFAQIKFNAD